MSYHLSVIVEEIGYLSRQTASKLKILTKVLLFMLVAIFFFFHHKWMRRFYSLCTADAPSPFLRGGVPVHRLGFYWWKGSKWQECYWTFHTVGWVQTTSNKKHTGIIKTVVGLHSHSTFINFVSVYVSNLTDYVNVKMGTRPSSLDSC